MPVPPSMLAAEWVLRRTLRRSPETVIRRVERKAFEAVRSLIVRVKDPLVRVRIGTVDLELPLSHELPRHLMHYPNYGWNLGRIAREVGGPVIDVGANVGDSAAIVRAETDASILCIEGDPRSIALLERNAARLDPPAVIEKAFVAAQGGAIVGRLARTRGTTRIVEGEGTDVRVRRLSEILTDHRDFTRPRLIKLDTDGFDVPIILAELEFLSRVRPVLFFEYDPHLGAHPGVFDRLREIGYERALVYENTGELTRFALLGEDDIHSPYVGHRSGRYADICAMSREDRELATAIVQTERARAALDGTA